MSSVCSAATYTDFLSTSLRKRKLPRWKKNKNLKQILACFISAMEFRISVTIFSGLPDMSSSLLFFQWSGYARKLRQGYGSSRCAMGLPLFSPQVARPCLCTTWTQTIKTAELQMMHLKGVVSLPWATEVHFQLQCFFQWSYLEREN